MNSGGDASIELQAVKETAQNEEKFGGGGLDLA